MTQDPELTAVIEAWPRLAPDARRMLARLAKDCLDPANAGAFRNTAGTPPTMPSEPPCRSAAAVQTGDQWPELSSSSTWERHDDPEMT